MLKQGLQKIPPEMFEMEEVELKKTLISLTEMQEWVVTFADLIKSDNEQIKDHFFTYYRFYCDLVWQIFHSLDEKFLVQNFSRMIPGFIFSRRQAFKRMLELLSVRSIGLDDLMDNYGKIQNDFISSNFILGENEGVQYAITDFVKDAKLINRESTTSIEQAEFMTRMKNIILSNGKENLTKYYTDDVDGIVIDLVDLVNFFLAIKVADISYVVDAYSREKELPYDEKERDSSDISDLSRNEEVNEGFKNNDLPATSASLEPNKSEIKIEVSSVPVQKPEDRSAEIVQAPKPTAPSPQPIVKKEESKSVEVKKEEVKIAPPPKPEVKQVEVKPEPKPEPKKIEVKLPEVKKEEKKPEPKPVVKPVEKKPEAKPDKTEDPMFFLSKKAPQPPKKEIKKETVKEENLQAPKALQQAAAPKKADIFAPIDPGKKHLSYKEIRRQIESRFPKDKTGHFLNIVDVMHELERIGHEQGDLKVRDLYYFNEQSGSFEWNENLLKD